MSNYAVLAHVGETLKKLIEEHLAADPNFDGVISGNEITLDSPDTDSGGAARLSCYLYRVVENPFLKNQRVNGNQPMTETNIPLALDLFYLVTPDTGNTLKDQLVIGKVVQVFHDHAILRGSQLVGASLSGSNTELRLVFHSLPFEEIIQLWQSFSNRSFRFSVCYRVTPVLIDGTETVELSRVTRKNEGWSQGDEVGGENND